MDPCNRECQLWSLKPGPAKRPLPPNVAATSSPHTCASEDARGCREQVGC